MTVKAAQPRGAAEDPWLTADEVAKYARCSAATVKTQAQLGRLKGVKLSGTKRSSWRFRRSWVDAWLESGQVAS